MLSLLRHAGGRGRRMDLLIASVQSTLVVDGHASRDVHGRSRNVANGHGRHSNARERSLRQEASRAGLYEGTAVIGNCLTLGDLISRTASQIPSREGIDVRRVLPTFRMVTTWFAAIFHINQERNRG